jgi:hypothetical protein
VPQSFVINQFSVSKRVPPLKLSEALPKRTRSSRSGRDLADRIYQYQPEAFSYSRQPIYDGYPSVELRGKGGAVVWSYVAKPGKFQWNDVPQDLTRCCTSA